MDVSQRIEGALERALAPDPAMALRSGPPLLEEAIRYAVFPAGHRIRPRLCLSVAMACGDSEPRIADAAAAAIELLHCASLVHDDLPCFDDADTRRGKPSVHRAYGEPLALLVGDALIIQAFQEIGRVAHLQCERTGPLLRTISAAVGTPGGIVAGQAWECEEAPDLRAYHCAKTGALFAGAAVAGAVAAGVDGASDDLRGWYRLGARLGEAYQVADDLMDAGGDAEAIGKPVGQDEQLDRPSAVRELGVAGAHERLGRLIREALDAIPACAHRDHLCAAVREETSRLAGAARESCAA
ncbi:MAG: polyprenyl synthetase family protein [Pseudomonadales bacterium]|jgi:geranylgeranyl diphosphate synthase type II|nr:polyprenyl synthetase family protein [Pseudomonadales bacterium]